jgi:hypothetical protein
MRPLPDDFKTYHEAVDTAVGRSSRARTSRNERSAWHCHSTDVLHDPAPRAGYCVGA